MHIYLFLASLASAAKPPKEAPVAEPPPPPEDPGYILTPPELELMGFMTDHCNARSGPHPGECAITVNATGLATIMAPAQVPCVPDLPTDSCSPPVAVGYLNGGNPLRTTAIRMGCSDIPTSFILCSISLAIPPVTPFEGLQGLMPTLEIFSRKAGMDKDLELYTWSFSPDEQALRK